MRGEKERVSTVSVAVSAEAESRATVRLVGVGTGRVNAPRRRWRRAAAPYGLILPAALVVFVFTVVTFGFTFGASLTNWNLDRLGVSFVGLSNYRVALADPLFRSGVFLTMEFVLGVVIISVGGGCVLGLLLNIEFRGRALVRTVVIAPWVMSEIASGVMWVLILAPQGIVSRAASLLGVAENPLGGAHSAMIWLILVESWRSVGLVTVLVLAALQGIDPVLYEAGRVEGASSWVLHRRITLPLIASTVLVSAMLLVIGNVNEVTMIFALTNGGPVTATQTLAFYMYQQSFSYYHLGYGSALAVVLCVINAGAMLSLIGLLGKRGSTE